MSAALLAIEGLSADYGGTAALERIDLALEAGAATALLGANGSGKSTLLKAILGAVPARAGRVLFDGADVTALAPEKRARLGLGYAPEGRRVFPGLSVRENLLVASWEGRARRAARLAEMLALFPVLAERARDAAWQLSGGQQQMLSLARALMNRPRLLLLDEPTLGLSPRLTEALFGRIPQIVASGTAILLAEQNVAKALAVCDHGVVLKLGRVAARGTAASLARDPAVEAAFLGG
ncbi:MAG TPA: ABC transporter ATP-binding protein [Alphaproteobacteria bacterium]|nr:ABC transporter ATP-binding protein [Alphaproteobacteria bacterium]